MVIGIIFGAMQIDRLCDMKFLELLLLQGNGFGKNQRQKKQLGIMKDT